MVGKDIRAQVFHSIQVKVLATFLLILLPVYVLGAVIFHWTYLQMHQQIIRSQMALLNLYAETIDDEISRIRLLEYNCINDDDLVYLANAYPILDTFERSQYLLRAQHRLQVMKNSSMCIGNVVLHLPTVGKKHRHPQRGALGRKLEPSAGSPTVRAQLWADTDEIRRAANEHSVSSHTPGREHSASGHVADALQRSDSAAAAGDGSHPGNGPGSDQPGQLLCAGENGQCVLSEPGTFDRFAAAALHRRSNRRGKALSKTVVALEESDLVLISFSSTEHLFGFRHTYLFLLVLFGVVSVLAMCLFAFSVRHLVHKPIRTLVDAFRCMKGNNFDVRIHQKRNDEFAYLYQSFNGMMDHLQKVDRAGIRPAPSDPAGGTQAASVPNQPTFSVQRVLQYLPHGQKKTATMTLPSSPSC